MTTSSQTRDVNAQILTELKKLRRSFRKLDDLVSRVGKLEKINFGREVTQS